MKNWPDFWWFTGFIALAEHAKEQKTPPKKSKTKMQNKQTNKSVCLKKYHPPSFLLLLQIEN